MHLSDADGVIIIFVRMTGLGNLQKAFEYCNMINGEGQFVGNLRWQQCALRIAEVSSCIHALITNSPPPSPKECHLS